MLSDEWVSRYGLLENFNASVTRTGTRTGTGTWTTGVTAIALCTSCSRAKHQSNPGGPKLFKSFSQKIDGKFENLNNRLPAIANQNKCYNESSTSSMSNFLLLTRFFGVRIFF